MNSGNINTSLEHLCRTCMKGNEIEKETVCKQDNAISIFDEVDSIGCENFSIMELLMLTTPKLNIESEDLLPKTVCEDCLKRLINAYKFQKMCIGVEQKLREMATAIRVEYEVNNDPISTDNVDEFQTVNKINILNINMDEHLRDQNEYLIDKIAVKNAGAISKDTDRSENIDEADCSDDDDWESEWEISAFIKKSKKAKQTLETLNSSAQNSNIITNTKNGESKNIVCNEYRNRLSSRSSLERHKRKYQGTKGMGQINTILNGKDRGTSTFQCDVCGNLLPTCKELKQHKRIHLAKKKKHHCEFCKRVYQRKSSLKEHLKKHTGEQQKYLCSECGKIFNNATSLQQHFLRHGTARSYMCPDCPKAFSCASGLSAHKSVHSDIKAYVCNICGSAFKKPYLLKKHGIYHTAERNYKCNYCEMSFIIADHLRRHLRTHTGEKPYKCKYCGKGYAQSNDLIKHLRVHLGDNVYKCDLCPQRFRLLGDLRAHFYAHKNDDEETRLKNLRALEDDERRLQIKFGLIKCSNVDSTLHRTDGDKTSNGDGNSDSDALEHGNAENAI